LPAAKTKKPLAKTVLICSKNSNICLLQAVRCHFQQ